MAILTPREAAAIAGGVYALQLAQIGDLGKLRLKLGCEDLFETGDANRFEGRTGIPGWRALSGFGYVAQGTGRFAGDVLIAIRGTSSDIPDWLTDGNIGLTNGPSGHAVHQGFQATWTSFAPELRTFLRGRNPNRIHCVGHSLGGALASLTADMLAGNGAGDVVLYTFGCPRTGAVPFARDLTRRIGADQIFRVVHPSDPVPMVPLFPFMHMPEGHGALTIARNGRGLISGDAHKMEPSYIPGVENHASWNSLIEDSLAPDESAQVRSWLERTAEGHGGLAMGSAALLSMIGRALRWILAEAAAVGFSAVSAGFTVSFTVLDRLAWLLSQAAALSRTVAHHIKGLMAAIFAFLGRTLHMVGDLTVGLIRWVLDMLYTSLRIVAQRAVQAIGR